MNSKRQTLLSITLIVWGFVGVYFLSGIVEESRPPMPAGYEDEDLVFKGLKLKDFSLGLNGLIADWYWMQSLQYLGKKFADSPDKRIDGNDLREFEPKLLYPLLDNAVSFDPHFMGVYQYGAVVLPAVDQSLAIEFIEKGIKNNPNEWRLYNHLGYIYWKSGAYEKAAVAYLQGSKIDGASSIMLSMAAKMKNDAGSRETAREIYSQMAEEANDTKTKETAEIFLARLAALDEIDAMNQVLKNFDQKNNRCVNNLRELLPLLSNVNLPKGRDFRIDNDRNPVDPTGAPYLLDSADCSVGLDKQKTTLPTN